MFGQVSARSRLKSRKSFLSKVQADAQSEKRRMELWEDKLSNLPAKTLMSLRVKEELPAGADAGWVNWKCLNRLRSGTGRCKTTLKRWGCLKTEDDICVCKSEQQTMAHILRCPLLEQECKADDLAEYNDVAKSCVQLWQNHNI
jgi:hypothetical protein